MNKKYELTDETKWYKGCLFHRIRALKDFSDVKKGDLGGWVESEANLSQKGDCWIYNEAMAYKNVIICDNARVYDDSEVFGLRYTSNKSIFGGQAQVRGHAEVFCDGVIIGNIAIYGEITMEKKYELTDETKIHYGCTLHRIRALKDFSDVKKGDLGGWVEKEDNLAQDGDCWIYDDAEVFDNATVCDNATVRDHSMIGDHAAILNNAMVWNYAIVWNNARVCDYAIVRDHVILNGNAIARGRSIIGGYSTIGYYGNARIYE